MLVYDPTKLNQQQLRMVELFKQPWPDEDFDQVRDLIVQILAKRIDEEMERLEKERGWTSETYEQWGNEHMRTPYRDAL